MKELQALYDRHVRPHVPAVCPLYPLGVTDGMVRVAHTQRRHGWTVDRDCIPAVAVRSPQRSTVAVPMGAAAGGDGRRDLDSVADHGSVRAVTVHTVDTTPGVGAVAVDVGDPVAGDGVDARHVACPRPDRVEDGGCGHADIEWKGAA